MRARHCLFLFLAIWLSASAQTLPDVLGPGDEPERELGAVLLKTIPADGEKLVNAAVARRAVRDKISETQARILVNRKLAAFAIEQHQWQIAEAHYNAALQMAELAEDAGVMIDLYLARARVRFKQGNRGDALTDARVVWDLSKQTNRPAAQILAGMEIVEIWHLTGRPSENEIYYEEMLALPGADRFALVIRRAETTLESPLDQAERRWREVATLAAEKSRPDVQSRALDQLGRFANARNAWGESVAYFRESEMLGSSRRRSPSAWFAYSEALTALERPAEARVALDRALSETDPTAETKMVADFEDARATLLARLGEPAAAYEALRKAQKLRAQAPVTTMRMALTRQVPPTPLAGTQQAAALAAVRNELREAELARAKIKNRATLGVALSAVCAAAALGLAYFYKRRAARALALAKDAAELRAERTHWQMLRYQLNPHFLYNALASLSGLIVTDAAAARRTVGRLSDFCRLALQRSTGDLRKVEEEIQLLAAFLDVEQAGAGDRLRVRFEIDPASRSCRLPPLLLQPLVENALKYGDANADDVREVVISARCAGERLVLEVANTGQWIEPSSSEPRLLGSGSSLGLANVRERLHRVGAGASLETTVSGGWVRMQVALPLLKTDVLPEATPPFS